MCIDKPTYNYSVQGTSLEVSGWSMTNVSDTKIKVFVDDMEAVEILDRVPREDVLEAYNNYIVISSEEQKALLDEEKVNHLLKLYGQVIDIDYPSLTEEELNNVVGTYTGIDSEDTTFNLVINADGSGTFVVDHQTNDEQDKSLTFDKVRHYNDSTLQIITNDSSTFTFTIDENNNIVLKYYVSNIELNKSTNKKDTNTNNNALPIILGSVGGVIVVGGLAVAFILLRKKKVTGGK